MKNFLNRLLRPFEKIAGWQALGWGLAGIAVSIPISRLSGIHYHGLLHFGPAPNDAWWAFAAEHLIVWIVPALLFWIGGLLLSRSRIRPIDVFGTTAFAQIPLLGMSLFAFTPPMQRILHQDFNQPLSEIMADTQFISDAFFSMIGTLFLVLTLIWMFNALKVSCNLKGAKLGLWYVLAVIGGDAICRILITNLYSITI